MPALISGSYSNDLTGNTAQYQTAGAWEQAHNSANNNTTMKGGRRFRKSKKSKSKKSKKSKKSCGCKKIRLW